MSNPSVTATIAVDDKASPALRSLAQLSKTVGQDFGKSVNGDALANAMGRANDVAREHIGALTSIRNLYKQIGGIAAGIAATKLFGSAKSAVSNFLPYEKDVRYQTAIQGFGLEDQKMLDAQRVEAAKKFGVLPMDTLHAQQAFVTRNFSAPITKAATDQALILSKALNVQVEEASKIVEGITFAQGIHLKDPTSATFEMRKSSDRAAIAAKAGAMSPEDVRQFAKYGMGMSTAAGISADQAYAIGMTLKRANVGGDESGVFMRQMSARLMNPTKQAFEAFAHMGLNYADFATQGAVTPEAISASLQRRYGKGLSAQGVESLRGAFEDDSRNVLGSREEFAAAVRDAVMAGGEKLSKTDEKHLVDTAVRQYDLSKNSLRGGDLLEAILSKGSAKDLQAIIGDKQGGRAVMLLNALEQYREYLTKLSHSDGYAEKIAKERMEGAAAAVDRFNASLDTASKKLVEANQGIIERGANLAASGLNWFIDLGTGAKQAATALIGVATAAAAVKAVRTAAGVVRGLTGVEAAGVAAAGGAATTSAVPLLGMTAIGAGLGYITSSQVESMNADQRRAVIGNAFDPDLAFGTAIMGDGGKHGPRWLRKQRLERQDNPMWDAIRPGLEHVGETFGSLVSDLRAIIEGRYGDTNLAKKDWSAGVNKFPSEEGGASPAPVTVEGNITGQAEIRITGTTEPSPWFSTTFHQMQQDIVQLKGSIGGDKVGTGMSGSNGAKPAFNTGAQP